ncbi:hypothetical protein B0T24DRAFT_712174, partial [Lasiosphaeria ovina]
SEFQKEVRRILLACRVKRVNISPYNSKANGVNKSGHVPITACLAKLTTGTGKKWRSLLPLVLFADRTTIWSSHGKTPFFLVHNYEPLMLVELDVLSWRVVHWEAAQPTTPVRSDEDEEIPDAEARKTLIALRAREKAAAQRDAVNAHKHRPTNAQIKEKDLVLAYDVVRKIDMSTLRKLTYRWNGPYRVRKFASKQVYLLETLDGVKI